MKIHDISNWTVLLADIPIRPEDFGSDTVLSIKPKGPAFETESGAGGEVCRSATHEYRHDVEVTLMNCSSVHGLLSALHAIDTSTPGGSGVGAMLVKDNNGATLFAAEQCWIAKRPDLTVGKMSGESTWVFEAVAKQTTMIQGGN